MRVRLNQGDWNIEQQWQVATYTMYLIGLFTALVGEPEEPEPLNPMTGVLMNQSDITMTVAEAMAMSEGMGSPEAQEFIQARFLKAD